jgi:hypothetical protein
MGYFYACQKDVDMLADDSEAKKHRDLCRTEIERSEANVVKDAEAIVVFINSFEMEQRDKLYCISARSSFKSILRSSHCERTRS